MIEGVTLNAYLALVEPPFPGNKAPTVGVLPLYKLSN